MELGLKLRLLPKGTFKMLRYKNYVFHSFLNSIKFMLIWPKRLFCICMDYSVWEVCKGCVWSFLKDYYRRQRKNEKNIPTNT